MKAGVPLVVLDHKHLVAMLVPFEQEHLFLRGASERYQYRSLSPLTSKDPIPELERKRDDRW